MMLCDQCDEDERVQLFDLGSDDLVVKPFGMKELLARVRALLRRQVPASERTVSQSIFTTGDLTIDYAQHVVTMQGRVVQLSRTEYKLLSMLAQNVGMVVTHELLLKKSGALNIIAILISSGSTSVGCGARLRPICATPNTSSPSPMWDISSRNTELTHICYTYSSVRFYSGHCKVFTLSSNAIVMSARYDHSVKSSV